MPDRLHAVLERSRTLGFLGPGEVDLHRVHALGFATAWSALRERPPSALCDLGAGGGVPGLVLAANWPESSVVLLEASARRCRFLREAAVELELPRVEVVEGRAETMARSEQLEGRFPLVLARSFGPPAVTAECGARLLEIGGLLIVSEPPLPPGVVEDPSRRWPSDQLMVLGLRLLAVAGLPRFATLDRVSRGEPRFPRRVGVPAKRPLF